MSMQYIALIATGTVLISGALWLMYEAKKYRARRDAELAVSSHKRQYWVSSQRPQGGKLKHR